MSKMHMQSSGQQSNMQSQHGQQRSGAQQSTMQQSAGGAGGGQALFPTQNFLSEEVRETSIAALNQCLADTTVMYFQLKSAHWNVKGGNFYQLHELFDDLAGELEAYIDDLAERVTSLGGLARGTTREVAQASTLPQLPPEVVDETELLERIAENLSMLDSMLFQQMNAVEEYGDLDTVDLLNEISRTVSKSLWFVEAHLQGGQQRGSQRMGGNQQGQRMQSGGTNQQMHQDSQGRMGSGKMGSGGASQHQQAPMQGASHPPASPQ